MNEVLTIASILVGLIAYGISMIILTAVRNSKQPKSNGVAK